MNNSNELRQAAARELIRRRRGREDLCHYANAIEIPGKPQGEDPDAWLFQPVETALASHHLLLLQAFERTATRRHGRLMVFMPPGSAKSTYCSVVAPTYVMGKVPDSRIILASYGQDLARRHGRRARQVVRSKGYGALFGATASATTSAADEWSLTNGSEYLACGILSGITGNRAHGIVIDDPVKGREQADSPTIRKKTWDAYNDDLLTRLIPGGWVVLVQCMTGDTPVLMATGEEKSLKDVRPGDSIATYDKGTLSTSKILKWKNNGPDSVYKIIMKSGITVRANERHPFLALKDGKEQWIRLKNLKPGDCILRVTGANGAGQHAQRLDAMSQCHAKDCANRTTTKSDGPTEFARHRQKPILRHESAQSSSTDTASHLTITKPFLPSKGAFAPSAAEGQKKLETPSIGTTFCALTTATTQTRLEGCCAMTATSQSGEGKRLKSLSRQQSTSDFTPDEIVSIDFDGVEDVFDIQVDRTENFIANWLVSHNTRWHEDDLAGRLLPKGYAGESGMIECTDGKMWEVINLPAQAERADDPLGRKVGEYLWPEWFDAGHWDTFKRQSRTWAALFQQRPRPDEGGVFKELWARMRYGAIPAAADLIVHSWDTAQKPGQLNDPTVLTVWRLGRGVAGYFLAEVYRERIDYPTLKRKAIAYAKRDNPAAILIEDKSSGQSLIQELRASTTLPVIPIEPLGDKTFRANEVSAMVEAGLLHLPETATWLVDFESEFFGFPLVANDDQVDSVTQFLKWVRGWGARIESHGAGITRAVADSVPEITLGDGFGSVSRDDGDLYGFD